MRIGLNLLYLALFFSLASHLSCGSDEGEGGGTGTSTGGSGTGTDDGSTGGSSGLTSTLSSIQENIFTPTCATSGCHSAASASESLILTSGQSFSELVNVDSQQDSSKKLVNPGSPTTSYLIDKLNGTGKQSRMPKGSSALSDSELDAIEEWITNGAADN